MFFFAIAGEFRLRKPPPTTGGLLCEEMGLGKTVEVIATILGNPRTDIMRRSASTHMLLDDDDNEAGGRASNGGYDDDDDDDADESPVVVSGASGASSATGRAKAAAMVAVPARPSSLLPAAKSRAKPNAAEVMLATAHANSSRSTLIVVPSTLVAQWWNELYDRVEGACIFTRYP